MGARAWAADLVLVVVASLAGCAASAGLQPATADATASVNATLVRDVPLGVELSLSPSVRDRVLAKARQGETVTLRIDTLRGAGGVMRIYLNTPQVTPNTGIDVPGYVSTVAFDAHPTSGGPRPGSYLVDLSPALRLLPNDRSAQNVRITLLLTESPDTAAEADPGIVIRRLSLIAS